MIHDMRHLITLCETKQNVPTLARVEALAKKLNVTLTLDEDTDNIYLQWLERAFGEKGGGRQVMDALCIYADYTQKKMSLEVLGGDRWLMNYYQSFGFKISSDDEAMVNAGYWEEEGEGHPGPTMLRRPRRLRRTK